MAAMEDGTKLWRAGIVPYEINADLGNIAAIHDAITAWEEASNIRFVGRTNQEDFIRFSKATQGNSTSKVGRQGGGQFVNASLADHGTLIHEIGHAVGLMHEHQRDDRDEFMIFHADRIPESEEMDQYEKLDTHSRTERYDFRSVMHYDVRNPSNPVFESRTGLPPIGQIGNQGIITVTDRSLLEALYPADPIVRRSDGEGGARAARQTSALAVAGANSSAILATAIRNGSDKYHLVRWRVRETGIITRMDDFPASAGGSVFGTASMVHMIAVGRLFVAAMRDEDDELLLISHKNSFERLMDSGNQALGVKALHAVALSDNTMVTACIDDSDRLLLIVWRIGGNGSITRKFDSGNQGTEATAVAATALPRSGPDSILAVVTKSGSGRLVLSTWRIGAASVELLGDSGKQMAKGDLAQVVAVPPDHLVVVCRDGATKPLNNLLLIPFALIGDGSVAVRVTGGTARTVEKMREVAAISRPYGLLTAIIDGNGNLLLIKWKVEGGAVRRLGDSGTQAGLASQVSVAALPFDDKTTVCTAVRNASGRLLPISWDDSGGPGELEQV